MARLAINPNLELGTWKLLLKLRDSHPDHSKLPVSRTAYAHQIVCEVACQSAKLGSVTHFTCGTQTKHRPSRFVTMGNSRLDGWQGAHAAWMHWLFNDWSMTARPHWLNKRATAQHWWPSVGAKGTGQGKLSIKQFFCFTVFKPLFLRRLFPSYWWLFRRKPKIHAWCASAKLPSFGG